MARALELARLRCPRSGKSAFVDQATAEEWMRRQEVVQPGWGTRDRTPTSAYECSDCGWWHLTSSDPKEAAA